MSIGSGRPLGIDDEALRHGCERAEDWFMLQRLRPIGAATDAMADAFDAYGLNEPRRAVLIDHLRRMVWLTGDPLVEANMAASMLAGVLIGLMLAETTMEQDDKAPPFPPAFWDADAADDAA